MTLKFMLAAVVIKGFVHIIGGPGMRRSVKGFLSEILSFLFLLLSPLFPLPSNLLLPFFLPFSLFFYVIHWSLFRLGTLNESKKG
ncbi:hypothetical protein BGZ63DRAFT_377487, partial [Mariannaea sp. PMI_226]